MRVCGVELKGNDANIVVMSKADGLYDLPHIRVPRISIKDGSDQEEVRKFQFTFKKLLEDYQIDKIVIKGRALKGKFAGGGIGFKLEAALQLIEGIDAEIISASTIKTTLAKTQIGIDFRDTGLKKFQESAFEAVFCYLENN
jgi:hypothetical protein